MLLIFAREFRCAICNSICISTTELQQNRINQIVDRYSLCSYILLSKVGANKANPTG